MAKKSRDFPGGDSNLGASLYSGRDQGSGSASRLERDYQQRGEDLDFEVLMRTDPLMPLYLFTLTSYLTRGGRRNA